MLKRYTAILLLTIASAILMGHNLIPHHHHHLHNETAYHHHTDEGHDGDEESNVFGHFFAHVFHEAAFESFVSNESVPLLLKHLLSVATILPDYYFYRIADIPPLIHNPLAERPYCLTYCASALALRGPPAFLV